VISQQRVVGKSIELVMESCPGDRRGNLWFERCWAPDQEAAHRRRGGQ
jgi:hypothetical protein